MTLRTAEGVREVHMRVNKARNYKTVGCIDYEIG
jgi:hypothetical protein